MSEDTIIAEVLAEIVRRIRQERQEKQKLIKG